MNRAMAAWLAVGCTAAEPAEAPIVPPTVEDLGPPPTIPETGWVRTHRLWDQVALPEPEGVVEVAARDPQAPFSGQYAACFSLDDRDREALDGQPVYGCPTLVWCDWALTQALTDRSPRWTDQVLDCGGAKAWAWFGPQGEQSDAVLVKRAHRAPFGEPVHLTSAALRAFVDDPQADDLDLRFLLGPGSIDRDAWKSAVMAAHAEASTLRGRRRLGRALSGFADPAAVRAYIDGCDPEHWACETATYDPPTAPDTFETELAWFASFGAVGLQSIVARVRVASPKLDVDAALEACARSPETATEAMQACLTVLATTDEDRARNIARTRLSSGDLQGSAARRWLRMFSVGGAPTVVPALAELGLIPASADPAAVLPGASAIEIMRAWGRASPTGTGRRGTRSIALVRQLLHIADIDGVRLETPLSRTRVVHLSIDDQRYAIPITATDVEEEVVEAAAIVNAIAVERQAARRLMLQPEGTSLTVVSGTPSELAAGIEAGWLSRSSADPGDFSARRAVDSSTTVTADTGWED